MPLERVWVAEKICDVGYGYYFGDFIRLPFICFEWKTYQMLSIVDIVADGFFFPPVFSR